MSFNTDEAEQVAVVLWTWRRGLLSAGGCPMSYLAVLSAVITNGQIFV